MNRIHIILILTGMLLPTLFLVTGCKKGENDPMLTLRTRKARLTGDWLLKSGDMLYKTNLYTRADTFSNDTLYSKVITGGNTSLTVFAHRETQSFFRDGSYEVNIQKSYIGGTQQTIKQKGHWQFIAKTRLGKLKHREALMITVTEYGEQGPGTCNCTRTETQPLYGDIYLIDQLKNSEIILKINNTIVSPEGSLDLIGTFVLEKQ